LPEIGELTIAVRSERDKKRWGLVAGFLLLTAGVTVVFWYFGAGGADAFRLAESADRRDRLRAIEMLRGRRRPAARAALARLAWDGDWRVAAAAIGALGEAAHDDSAHALLRIARDANADPRVRAEAATALGSFGQTPPAALAGLLTNSGDPRVRAGAAKGLVSLRSREALGALVRALADRDGEVRRWSIAAIHRMTPRRFPYDPQRPPATQRRVIARIEAYFRQCGVL
jgi:hypothetical protein